MGLPTNFSKQTTQLERRWDSLNELKYYTVEYTLHMSEAFEKKMEDETVELDDKEVKVYPLFWDGWFDLGVYDFNGENKQGLKRFPALDEEKAKNKFDEWTESLLNQNIIDSYEVVNFNENTLEEELEETDVLPILKLTENDG